MLPYLFFLRMYRNNYTRITFVNSCNLSANSWGKSVSEIRWSISFHEAYCWNEEYFAFLLSHNTILVCAHDIAQDFIWPSANAFVAGPWCCSKPALPRNAMSTRNVFYNSMTWTPTLHIISALHSPPRKIKWFLLSINVVNTGIEFVMIV